VEIGEEKKKTPGQMPGVPIQKVDFSAFKSVSFKPCSGPRLKPPNDRAVKKPLFQGIFKSEF